MNRKLHKDSFPTMTDQSNAFFLYLLEYLTNKLIVLVTHNKAHLKAFFCLFVEAIFKRYTASGFLQVGSKVAHYCKYATMANV